MATGQGVDVDAYARDYPGGASVGVMDPHMRLAAAILAQAAHEAQAGNPGAIEWFGSEAAALMARVIGLNPKNLEAFRAALTADPNAAALKPFSARKTAAARTWPGAIVIRVYSGGLTA